MWIKHDLLSQILALPRETLISDLHKVIYDSIARYEYFNEEYSYDDEKQSFITHAIFLLTEIKSVESLQVMLDLLRQDEDFSEYWFADWREDFFWQYFYMAGLSQLNILIDFLKEPDRPAIHRILISNSIVQMVMHHPDRRMEVVQQYREFIRFYISHEDDDRLIDTDFTGFFIWDLLDIGAKELIPEIKELFIHNLVNPRICGQKGDVLQDMEKEPDSRVKHDILSIYEQYDKYNGHLAETVNQQDTLRTLKGDQKNTSLSGETLVRQTPRVGRNDPCPCGSGKKYKKCCVDKYD